MTLRTVGVEEELLLLDPETREASPRSQQVLKYAAEHGLPGAEDLEQELYRHQLETRTSPTTDLSDLRADIVRGRRAAAQAAEGAGLLTAAVGAIPLGPDQPRTTRDDRYLHMVDTYGDVARSAGTCGMHVHVAITSDEEGVRVIDALAPWLPVILAISANSPYYEGRSTGYASWRARLWAQWPSAGPTEPFGTVEGYHEVGRRLMASGAARDDGMLYFDARLAQHYPTVEVRISDVCTDPDDAVLIVALVRALVEHCADAAPEDLPVAWRVEMLRAAQWRAARYGLGERLLDPHTGELAPARSVLETLVRTVGDQLAVAGDGDLVQSGVARVLADNGSVRQRAVHERHGSVRDVVDDLVARTNAGWRAATG